MTTVFIVRGNCFVIHIVWKCIKSIPIFSRNYVTRYVIMLNQGKFLFNSMLNDLELRSYWFYKLQTYWLLQSSTLFSYYYNRYNVCIMDMHAYIYTQTMDILKPLLPFTLLRALTVRGVHGLVRSVLERFFAPHLWGEVSPNA